MVEGGLRKKGILKGSRESNPLVSIVTVAFNAVDGLEETMLSVKGQLFDDVEYIIVDGGSNDGTVELIRNHEAWIDYWVSEADRGIYDALNKGIALAKGHFFYVLNVGDTLIELPHTELLDAKGKNADVVLFDVLFSDGRIFKSSVDYRTRFGNTIHHQGAFYRRELNIIYDLTYKVYSDFDVNQRLFHQGKKFLRYNKMISRHSLDGISNDRKYLNEYFAVIKKNFGFIWTVVGFIYFKQGELRMFFREQFNTKPGIR